jgi:hypothetical protein
VNLDRKTRNYSGTAMGGNGFAKKHLFFGKTAKTLTIFCVFPLRQRTVRDHRNNGACAIFAILTWVARGRQSACGWLEARRVASVWINDAATERSVTQIVSR